MRYVIGLFEVAVVAFFFVWMGVVLIGIIRKQD